MSHAINPAAPAEPLRHSPRLRRKDVAALAGQLGLMLETGIALDVALKAASEQSENAAVKQVAGDLESQIQDGLDLSTAMGRHPLAFEPVFVSLIRASEHTGSLAQCLIQQAEYLEKELAQRQQIRAAMAYPAIMLSMAVVITLILLSYVLPQFAPIFQQRGMELPALTKFLLAASSSLAEQPWMWVIGAIMLGATGVIVLKSTVGRRGLDAVWLQVPVLGRAYRKAVLSRSVRTLGLMLHNQVPILDALRLCAQVAGSQTYSDAWTGVAEDVAAGSRIGDSLPPQPMFPASLRQMLRAGEESGKLPVVLDRISRQYERDVESSFKAASAMLEPILIGGMGLVVGAIAYALLIPIFSLSRHG